jgi:hypothetical protein
MSDDIVTRLRAEGEMEPVGDGTKVWWPSEICQEAANEIERLRKDIKESQATISIMSRIQQKQTKIVQKLRQK